MDMDFVLSLIKVGETLDVEFKGEEKRALPDSDLIEAIVCLANKQGTTDSWLLLGVEDDGRITGVHPRENVLPDVFRMQALVSARTRPSLAVDITLVPFDNQKYVLAIKIAPQRFPVGTIGGKYIRRSLGGDGHPCCLPFHYHEMLGAQAAGGFLDYSSSIVTGATWADLDPLEFERLRRVIRESRGRGDSALLGLADIEVAKSLGAVEADAQVRHVRVLGLLLFGKEESLNKFLPTHEAAFQVVQGMEVKVNDFWRWPLLRIMDELDSRFRSRNQETEVMSGLLRIGVPDYPEKAFREAVANALVHRDYTKLGAVHIQWHPDRIEISSPGGLPEGVRLDNLLVTHPCPRSPLLADAFKRAGLVERTARGVDIIFYEQLRNGRPAPDYSSSTATSVVMKLPGGEANLDFVRLVAEENRSNRLLDWDELLLLNAIFIERKINLKEASVLVQQPESQAKSILNKLVEAGLIELSGSSKNREYSFSASLYKRFGQKAAYVRQHGFDPLQQEQMVIQYVQAHGSISRSEAADLCKVGPLQARDLLKRLKSREILSLTGKTSGAKYELASKNMD